ncbi:MAG: YceI family protein [Usitatibacter sp.]
MKRNAMKLPALLLTAILPAAAFAESYTLDKDHTQPSFEFSHMGISVWRGKFTQTSGRLEMDRKARTGEVQVVVNTNSIDFGHKGMNTFAVTEDWLNVEWHPTMSYQGKLRFEGDTPVALEGTLTLLGVSKPLTLRINSFKCIPHPIFKREVCGADAEGEFHRADFGMKQYSEGEAGRIKLRIQVEALKD